MYVDMLDPHPGRCRNTRGFRHPDGSYETLRCLDYEGTRHVCEFPEVIPRQMSGSYNVHTLPRPVPWEKPDA